MQSESKSRPSPKIYKIRTDSHSSQPSLSLAPITDSSGWPVAPRDASKFLTVFAKLPDCVCHFRSHPWACSAAIADPWHAPTAAILNSLMKAAKALNGSMHGSMFAGSWMRQLESPSNSAGQSVCFFMHSVRSAKYTNKPLLINSLAITWLPVLTIFCIFAKLSRSGPLSALKLVETKKPLCRAINWPWSLVNLSLFSKRSISWSHSPDFSNLTKIARPGRNQKFMVAGQCGQCDFW